MSSNSDDWLIDLIELLVTQMIDQVVLWVWIHVACVII